MKLTKYGLEKLTQLLILFVGVLVGIEMGKAIAASEPGWKVILSGLIVFAECNILVYILAKLNWLALLVSERYRSFFLYILRDYAAK